MEHARIYLFDNLKAILITLIVFGHVMELILWGRGAIALYSFIYLFHMPLFVFCSGYMAKYKPQKILSRLVFPYVVFQLLYILFEMFILGNGNILIQFTTPYWILWYLLALIVWMLTLPLLDILTNSRRNMLITICVSLLLGIFSGFDHSLGYYMSLSRIVYFFPFFIIGTCVKKAAQEQLFYAVISKWYGKAAAGVLSALTLLCLYLHAFDLDVRWFFGSIGFTYTVESYTIIVRLLVYLATFITSFFVLSIIPRKKLFFSYIGQRTMPVFLLHAFVVRLLWHYGVVYSIPGGIVMYAFLIAVSLAVVALFSSRLFDNTYNLKG